MVYFCQIGCKKVCNGSFGSRLYGASFAIGKLDNSDAVANQSYNIRKYFAATFSLSTTVKSNVSKIEIEFIKYASNAIFAVSVFN